MSFDDEAWEICQEIEARMREVGVITTAHYDVGTRLIAAALRRQWDRALDHAGAIIESWGGYPPSPRGRRKKLADCVRALKEGPPA